MTVKVGVMLRAVPINTVLCFHFHSLLNFTVLTKKDTMTDKLYLICFLNLILIYLYLVFE